MKRFLVLVCILGLFLLMPQVVETQTTADSPVVYAVFFYLPTCPHCHEIMDNVFPAWYEEFGDGIAIVWLNASQQEETTLFASACQTFNVPGNRCGSVPMMVIGQTVLIGSLDIPQIGTQLIRDGLANNGLPIPQFPGIIDYVGLHPDAIIRGETTSISSAIEIVAESMSLQERLANDPLANLLAIAILVGSIATLGSVTYYVRRGVFRDQVVQSVTIGLMILGALIAFSLVAKDTEDLTASLFAWSVLTLIAFAGIARISDYKRWVVPLVALAGLLVALYLSYIELTGNEATCGLVGDCNAVQQSAYASVIGIPMGVLGTMGYTLMLFMWGVATFRKDDRADAFLLGLAVIGVVFSAYLTFLEPFVIGSTCAWCLMSAVTMVLLLWLVAPDGLHALQKHHIIRRRSIASH